MILQVLVGPTEVAVDYLHPVTGGRYGLRCRREDLDALVQQWQALQAEGEVLLAVWESLQGLRPGLPVVTLPGDPA